MNHYSYDEIDIGHREAFEIDITEQMLDGFRDITGDLNPLHSDAGYARAEGYEDRVAYGMLTASFMSTLAGVYLPGERSLIHSVKTKFSGAVYPGDELTVEGTVTETNDTFELIIVKVLIRNQNGDKVCKAEMQVGIT